MSLFKTRQQIADAYGIDRKTLDRRLKKADIVLEPGNISPKDYQRITDYFGQPQSVANYPKVVQSGAL